MVWGFTFLTINGVFRFNKHVGLCEVLEVGCGLKHTVVLLEGGRLVSCGNNEKGQLGQDKSVTRPGICLSVCSVVYVCVCMHCHVLLFCSGFRSPLTLSHCGMYPPNVDTPESLHKGDTLF